VDSGLNSIATVLEVDFLRLWRRSQATAVREIATARWTTVLLGAVSTGVAFVMADIQDILDGFTQVASLFSAPVLALFALGILWRRTSFAAWLGSLGIVPPILSYVNVATKVNWSWRFPLSFVLTVAVTMVLTAVFSVFGQARAGARRQTGGG
jgi:Na+/proline symporter